MKIKLPTTNKNIAQFNKTRLLVAVLSLLIIPLYDSYINLSGFNTAVYLIALIPVYLVFSVASLITGRWVFSALMTHCFMFLLLYASARKYDALVTPLLFEDLLFLSDPGSAFAVFNEYVSLRLSKLLAVTLSILLLIGIFHYEKKWLKLLPRLLILSLLVITTGYTVDKTDVRSAYRSMGVADKYWSQSENQKINGLFTIFFLSALNTNHGFPEIDTEIEQRLLSNRHSFSHQESSIRPDIIYYLSESLFDPAIMADYEECEIIPSICELPEGVQVGEFEVPTYGGGTTKTEFAVLTGVNPLLFSQQLNIPYRKIMYKQANSIAWEMKKLGYRTIAIHPNDPEFYSRNVAMPNLGFDEYISKDQFVEISEKNGTYINDSDLNNEIFKTLSSSDQPVFVMAISIENHGPWGHRNIKDKALLETIKVPQSLTSSDQQEIKEYLYHVHFAEQSMLELVDYATNAIRPTVVFFFGDHLPGLSRIFDQLSFDDHEPARKQNTFYIYAKNFGEANLPSILPAYQVTPAILSDLGLLKANNFYDLYHVYFELNYSSPENNRQKLFTQAQIRQLNWQP